MYLPDRQAPEAFTLLGWCTAALIFLILLPCPETAAEEICPVM